MGIRKFFRYLLPLGLIVVSIVVVAVLVESIPAKLASLNFAVYSQGSVAPRTETTLVAEVAGQIASVSDNLVAGGYRRAAEVPAKATDS